VLMGKFFTEWRSGSQTVGGQPTKRPGTSWLHTIS
jgi:hypothetical protein